MANSVAYNIDCLEYMRTLPDNYFDLCVADPPYGSGLTETGGCLGWFSKYHQDGCSQAVNAERERERERGTTDSEVRGAGSRSTSAEQKQTLYKRQTEMPLNL